MRKSRDRNEEASQRNRVRADWVTSASAVSPVWLSAATRTPGLTGRDPSLALEKMDAEERRRSQDAVDPGLPGSRDSLQALTFCIE
jgi:hypothetical protein